jgi:hypothetical protein
MRSVGMYPRPVWTRRAAMPSAIVYRLTISRSLLEYSQGRRTDHTALKSGGICRQYDDMARFLCDWVAALACEMATRRPQRKAWSQFCLPVGQLRLKTEAKTRYVSTREVIPLVALCNIMQCLSYYFLMRQGAMSARARPPGLSETS